VWLNLELLLHLAWLRFHIHSQFDLHSNECYLTVLLYLPMLNHRLQQHTIGYLIPWQQGSPLLHHCRMFVMYFLLVPQAHCL